MAQKLSRKIGKYYDEQGNIISNNHQAFFGTQADWDTMLYRVMFSGSDNAIIGIDIYYSIFFNYCFMSDVDTRDKISNLVSKQGFKFLINNNEKDVARVYRAGKVDTFQVEDLNFYSFIP